METLRISNTEIISFLLVFFRTGAVLFTAPFLGSKNIPVRVRILLSCAIAIVLITALDIGGRRSMPLHESALIDGRNNVLLLQQFMFQQGVIGLFIAIFREVLLGIAIGYTARLTFIGIQLAGQLIGTDMGFGMMRILDPTTKSNVTIIAQYNTVVATLIFLLIDGHHYIIMGLAKSFSSIPLAGWEPSAPLIGHINSVFASIFSTGLKLAIPITGALFLTKFGMAIIARTMPQMNVFIVGFPLQISVGLMGLAISLPIFVRIVNALFISMRDNVWSIVR